MQEQLGGKKRRSSALVKGQRLEHGKKIDADRQKLHSCSTREAHRHSLSTRERGGDENLKRKESTHTTISEHASVRSQYTARGSLSPFHKTFPSCPMMGQSIISSSKSARPFFTFADISRYSERKVGNSFSVVFRVFDDTSNVSANAATKTVNW